MAQGGEAARADLRGGVGWMVLGGLITAASWRMDRFEQMGGTLYTAPGLVPGLFGLLLLLMGAALALRGWRGRAVGPAPEPLLNARVAGMLVLTLVYAAALVGRLPFAAITAIFMTLFCALFAPDGTPTARRWRTALLCGVLATAVIVVVFERVFLVRLP